MSKQVRKWKIEFELWDYPNEDFKEFYFTNAKVKRIVNCGRRMLEDEYKPARFKNLRIRRKK